MADKASLFKLTVKSLGSKFGITPCFMAKPREGLPGNSGHMHVSIVDKDNKIVEIGDDGGDVPEGYGLKTSAVTKRSHG